MEVAFSISRKVDMVGHDDVAVSGYWRYKNQCKCVRRLPLSWNENREKAFFVFADLGTPELLVSLALKHNDHLEDVARIRVLAYHGIRHADATHMPLGTPQKKAQGSQQSLG